MSKALFFNALPDATSSTGYDRNYNADDLSDFLSMVCDTGVVKTNTVDTEPQGLKVVAGSGMTVNVNAGKAAIRGKGFINDALATFTIEPNGTTYNRYDYIVVKYDNNVSVRNITLELVKGTSTKPTTVADTDKVRELMLAYIEVAPSVTSIAQSKITDTRGNNTLCPWFTAVKGYDDYYDAVIQKHTGVVVMEAAGQRAITKIPTTLYNQRYSIVNVYTNGIKEQSTNYELQVGSTYIVVNFKASKAAGTVILVELENFIDGEGMVTALAQYTQLVQDVADLKGAGEFNYMCNGVNDNILISNLVKTFMGANFYHSMKLNIIGNFGFTQMASGTGAITSRYMLFDFGTFANTPKPRAILDFSNCSEISVPISNGTYTYIFGGTSIEVVGANIYAANTAVDTTIRIFDNSAKRIKAEGCRFWVSGYKNSLIAINGTFIDCYGDISNVTENSYCFLPQSSGVVKVTGGEYYAYTGDANKLSAILGQSDADAVSILYGVSAPTLARSGYYQTNSLLQWTGGGVLKCTDLISALPVVVVASISEIRGTITKSKPNVW